MKFDYNELENRILKRMDTDLPQFENGDIDSKFLDLIHREAIYAAILVLAEYERMKEEIHS